MFKKAFRYILNFIKENIVLLIIIAVILILNQIKLPYSINMPGGATNLNDRYKIENSYKIKGSINMAYVSSLKANPISYIAALIIPSWDLEKLEEYTLENEGEKDYLNRGKKNLEESINVAKIVALRAAGYEINIKTTSLVVTYLTEEANTDLMINDEIIAFDNQVIESFEQIKDIVEAKKVNDVIKIKVIRDGKEKLCSAKVYQYEGNLYIGMMATSKYEYESNLNVKFIYEDEEYGPSGGLMNTLAIYNAITKEDITHGKKIIGTGTIDIDGNVGAVGGIKYKLIGANKKKCDIFIVPSANYDEAMKIKKKHKLKIKVVKVATFDEAKNYLEGMK
ncbi:MAG: PDZ domain-containing protein [Bacilli bacterium]|nr:PDZ domain-containing protein [Bacilli bacterium]